MSTNNRHLFCRLRHPFAACFFLFLSQSYAAPFGPSPSDSTNLGSQATELRSRPNGDPSQGSNAAKIELGRALFFDDSLSTDHRISCAACHKPELAFTDGLPVAVGSGKREGTRNTPSLLNVAFQRTLFWDGRATTLNEQARLPFVNAREHGLLNAAAVEDLVTASPRYRKAFLDIFGTEKPTIALVAAALVAYEQTLTARGSRFDQYQFGGNRRALSEAEIRGYALFSGEARCATCHEIGADSALFTDHEFHLSPLGIPPSATHRLRQVATMLLSGAPETRSELSDQLVTSDPDAASLGRFLVTLDPHDIGKFKTPSLRNVTLTGPYMHDGSVRSIDQAVELELYRHDTAIRHPIVLTQDQKQDLISFLKALSGTVDDVKADMSESDH